MKELVLLGAVASCCAIPLAAGAVLWGASKLRMKPNEDSSATQPHSAIADCCSAISGAMGSIRERLKRRIG